MTFDLGKISFVAVILFILWILLSVFGISSPYIPDDPNPANSSLGVGSENVKLCWSGGTPQSNELIKYAKLMLFRIEPSDSKVNYKIYFGKIEEFLSPVKEEYASIIKGKEMFCYPILYSLESNTTYYWKIITINDHGRTSEGPTWVFTTKPPSTASKGAVGLINNPPTITWLKSDLESPQKAGTTIYWTVKSQDIDGDLMYYRFLLERPARSGDFVTVQDWSTKNFWAWTPDRPGKYQVKVQVREDNHQPESYNDDSWSEGYAITDNEPPFINSLTPDKSDFQVVGTDIIWTADAGDSDGDQILYRFFLNGHHATEWTKDNIWVWKTNMANVGDNEIEVQVRDGKHADRDGFDDYRDVSFSIKSAPFPDDTSKTPAPITAPLVNQLPVVSDLLPDKPSPQMAGTIITWTAEASDPDDDQLSYKFFLNGPATNLGPRDMTGWISDSKWTWITSQADVGNNLITVNVRDGKNVNERKYDVISIYINYEIKN
jgi:hypothetical protein